MSNLDDTDFDYYESLADYFEFKEIIGKGAFATVVRAIDKRDGQECAVKIMIKKQLSQSEYKILQSEAQILAQLNHPNIVRFRDVRETENKVLISMELIKGGIRIIQRIGSLLQLMRRRISEGRWFTEVEIQTLLRHVMKALSYIHDQNIVHRDLKPENILISEENDFTTIRISDFGLSAAFNTEARQATFNRQCGTMIYMAPELLDGKIYSKSIDIWSVGVILFRLLNNGEHPYYQEGDTLESFRSKLRDLHSRYQSLSRMQESLLTRLTMYEPQQRYTAHQALMHPWLSGSQMDEIPQTMEEMFQGWKQALKFGIIIKAIMFLGSMKPKKQINEEYLKVCNQISTENEQVVSKVNQMYGRVGAIEKEAYDKLFQNYQDELTQLKKQHNLNKIQTKSTSSHVGIDSTNVTTNSPGSPRQTGDLSARFTFHLKRVQQDIQKQTSIKLIEQIEINEQCTDEQSGMDYLLQNNTIQDSSKTVKVENDSPPKKRSTKIRKTTKIMPSPPRPKQNRERSITNNSPKPTISQQQDNSIQRFKIQLKPLEKPIQSNNSYLPDIKATDKLMAQNNSIDQARQTQLSHFYEAKSQRPPKSRKMQSSLDREVIPTNILDLTSQALGNESPSNSNQYIFKPPGGLGASAQFNANCPPIYNYPIIGRHEDTRRRPGDFNSQRILSQSLKRSSVQVPDFSSERIYNFISRYVNKK